MTTPEFVVSTVPCETCSERSVSGTRVLLVRPGDALLIGNVGPITDPQQASALVKDLRETVGVKVVLFSADIDIDKVPTDA